MAEKGTDKFSNAAIVSVTESAANTLTFKKLETGVSIADKVAWLINRIEYFISPMDLTQFADSADCIYYGLTVSSSWATPALAETAIIDYNSDTYLENAAPTSFAFVHRPQVKDFSTMPGGGLLVPPVPLYLYAKGLGLADVTTVVARIAYTLKALTLDEYWELVEARRVITS